MVKTGKEDNMEDTKVNYVDNDDFYARMLDFKNKRSIDPKTRIPEVIGEYILKIATGVSKHAKFYKFEPIRDSMISQAVENCIRYIDNWNPQYGKPFNYFTTIAFYACMKVIGDEKFQFKIKHEAARRTGMYQLFEQVLKNGDNVDMFEENMYEEFSGRVVMDREMTFGVKEEWPDDWHAPSTRRGRKKKAESEDEVYHDEIEANQVDEELE